ncbi:MAG: hypothetical protein JWQ81_8568 [Amycolatopsis sp.]|uniref:hypothetical protein n=1 Tax=Amycolatopsis sp. TaxID=37632 RepID=UPI00262972C8|nr:hypothetical protein [Amycolatopsis sp.]MCU1687829.1 hypothetical protein [Amycolatopsis sp.]
MSKASDHRKALDDELKNWSKDVKSEPFNNAELSRKAQEQAAKARAERDGEQ